MMNTASTPIKYNDEDKNRSLQTDYDDHSDGVDDFNYGNEVGEDDKKLNDNNNYRRRKS